MKTVIVILLLLWAGPYVYAAGQPARFAIVIGENVSDDQRIPTLRYADDDAITTHRLLVEAGVESILLTSLDRDSRRLYPELNPYGPAGLELALEAFEELSGKMRERSEQGSLSEFFFIYSGHGNVEHGQGYIVLGSDRLTRQDLFSRILSRSPAIRNHVIVDACKSYFLVFKKGPGGKRTPYPGQFLDWARAELHSNTGFVLSTSSDRDSHEWERFQGGVFSHEVRSALRGGADANGDRRITYAELGAFLSTANHKIKNPRYRPDFVIRPPGNPPGDLSHELLGWSAVPSELVLDHTIWGHVYIETGRGERLLDLHPQDGRTFVLSLPAERPLFVRKADETEELVWKDGRRARVSELRPRGTLIARKGALHLAFENLFAEPFGPDRVAVYREQFLRNWNLLEVSTVQARAPVSTVGLVREIAQWTALGSVALGAALNLWGYQIYSSGGGSSQEEQVEQNRRIEDLNVAAGVFYGVAGAAAATWLVTVLWPDLGGDTGNEVVISPMLGPDSVGIGVGFRWGD